MKAVMIIYNQAHSSVVLQILDDCSIRGFTKWEDVQGRGTHRGEPHYGTHAWPSKNMAIFAVIEDAQVEPLSEKLKTANNQAEQQGLRAFVWDAESLV